MLQVGSLLDGKYKILNEIGHGGMSTVYLALNERANKTWAVKEVRKEGGANSDVLSQGLVAETEMLKKLNHPHLPSIIDVIDKDDSFIIVMDYIEGKSLQSVLEHNGAQDPEQVVEWAKQLCDVLGYLHSRKPPIIYRDMKPANVMLKPDGDVTLIDFGTAREFKSHNLGDTTWLGTRGYAAPEQFGGQGETDARTDIYNLGATMYHLMTGYSPADTNFVILPLGDLRPELKNTGFEYMVSKCCQPAREDRFQSCEELKYVLDHITDYNDKIIKRREVRWNVFIATIVIAILATIGTIGFKVAETRAVGATYESLIESAEMQESLVSAKDYYRDAAELRPADSNLYFSMLEKIMQNDNEFSPDEERVLESMSPYLDVFRERNTSEYARYRYELGRMYFFYYNNGYRKAANYLDGLSEEGSNLSDETDRKIAGTLYRLADSIGNSDVTVEDKNWATGTNTYMDRWNLLTDITNYPESIDTETGGQMYSVAMYRELLRQIATRVNEYKSAGVSKDMMLEAIGNADTYMENVEAGSTESASVKNLISQTKKASESAKKQVRNAFHVVGTDEEDLEDN